MRRPTSSGSNLPRVMTLLTEASQAHRLAVSGGIGPTSSTSHLVPSRPSRASRSTVTVTRGRSPPTDRPAGAVEPLAADIAEGVCPLVSRGPRVARVRGSGVCVQDAPNRGHERLADLGIEIAVHPDHPVQGGGHVKSPELVKTLRLARSLGVVRGLPPVGGGPAKVADAERPGRVNQDPLRAFERFGVRLTRRDQHSQRRPGYPAIRQGLPGRWHLLQRTCRPHLLHRGRPRHAELLREPR